MQGFISDTIKLTPALAYASGTADREGATLDMQGYDGVLMVVHWSAIHNDATLKVKAQQGALSNATDMADLAGTSQTIAGTYDDKVTYIDVYQPRERYVRLVIDKDTSNAVAESAMYYQYKAQFQPVTQSASVTGEQFVSPAEGTA